MDSETPYSKLDPATVLEAVEQVGIEPDGRTLALNSYENRVYQVGVEDARPVVLKFYRPGRWSDEVILEEHDFSLELVDAEIPVVAPLVCDDQTLLECRGYRYAIYPSVGGRWPELDTTADRVVLGRSLGRLHAVGAVSEFEHRDFLDPDRLGGEASDWLLEHEWLPPHLESAYESLTDDLLPAIEERFRLAGDYHEQRIHGDCHPGNILWSGSGPLFVDLDDCLAGPVVQDLWMLLSGERDEMRLQLSELLEGYVGFANFDTRQLWLIEALRTLRLIHYAAWIARRWHDPAFPKAFPWFDDARFWEEHVLSLREQAALMQEGPLEL
jgi:Ser/Thr protein kinase RdoA (MazF antagonist)